MSKIRNWRLMTKRDMLFLEYGYGMGKKDWEWYTGEGEEIAKEQHLAFEIGLATGEKFFPKVDSKVDYREAFVILGYAEKYGNSRGNQPVVRPDGRVGDLIVTSNLAYAQKRGDGVVEICTRSGSCYELEGIMGSEKEYLRPEEANMSTEELNEIFEKYFKVKREVISA